jgi:ribosome-binding protein aMBF1 (putative translation factor)
LASHFWTSGQPHDLREIEVSEKDNLAARLGVKPQQIQRYEASDYQTASFARLREIARLLGLDVRETVEMVQK